MMPVASRLEGAAEDPAAGRTVGGAGGGGAHVVGPSLDSYVVNETLHGVTSGGGGVGDCSQSTGAPDPCRWRCPVR